MIPCASSHARAAAWSLLALGIAGCEAPPLPAPDPATHAAQVEEWRIQRIENLTQPHGWLSLVGLYWLESGESTFGSDSATDLVYVADAWSVPPWIGTFEVGPGTVTFRAAPGVPVLADGVPVATVQLEPEPEGGPILLELESLQWLVIQRGDRLAVRARDSRSPVRTEFDGIDMYSVALEWRLPGRFEWKDPPDTIDVPNVLGTVGRTPTPASVRFDVNGESYRLRLWKDSDDPDNFFTAFADATNGAGSYGGGRFLWIDAPDELGRTVVDFNRAYNPPCVFTEYATCPLPPRDNRLSFAIEAGEKEWGRH